MGATEVAEVIKHALGRNAIHICAMLLNLRQWLQFHPQAATPPGLTRLLEAQKQERALHMRLARYVKLLATEREQRLGLLEDHLKA